MSSSIPTIPSYIKATYESKWAKFLCSGKKGVVLHSAEDSNSSFDLSIPSGWRGPIILHPSQQPEIHLAQATPEQRCSAWGYRIAFTGSAIPNRFNSIPRYKGWWFAFQNGSTGQVERFEWRRTKGQEVRSLGVKSGWKLVRMTDAPPPAYDEIEGYLAPEKDVSVDSKSLNSDAGSSIHSNEVSTDGSRPEGRSSDGHEVVAVMALGSWRSRKDACEFQLLGSGANGELGEAWSLMALMSALSIWHNGKREEEQAAIVTAVT